VGSFPADAVGSVEVAGLVVVGSGVAPALELIVGSAPVSPAGFVPTVVFGFAIGSPAPAVVGLGDVPLVRFPGPFTPNRGVNDASAVAVSLRRQYPETHW
jgi:hypothetical protein